MKATLTQLRWKLKQRTSVSKTGLVLSKNNPYFANSQQLSYMVEQIETMYQEGKDIPSKRYEMTDSQRLKLLDDVEDLKRKFLS